ncbi:serine/arginine repetitive matrix protein 2-like isoform X2 [Periplaneta americana]|uniref:serine/arginine repetitive matrix protein 2-like isoform X2 n=1 Tax=Periplaneta americana TaxID=6978 RepID=UPI0037E80018
MALYDKLQKCDDDDEDLEALRLAALQTLRTNKPSSVQPQPQPQLLQQLPVPGSNPGRGFRGGMGRSRPGRNSVFQRHRMNSNLIAIVPMSNEPSPGANSSNDHRPPGRGRGLGGTSSDAPKLGLPQHRYCKIESDQGPTNDEPAVSTKFSRYDDSNSMSSGDESEDDGETSDKESVGSGAAAELENDPDVILMEASEDEDSLEKLIDQLEQEMQSEPSVPVSNSVKPSSDSHKHKKASVRKSKHNVCDTSKSRESQGGKSTSKVVPVLLDSGEQKTNDSSDLAKAESLSVSVPQNNVSSSYILSHHKDDFPNEKEKSAKPSTVHHNSNVSPPIRHSPPVSSRKSRSKSPYNSNTSTVKNRRSRTASPRSRFGYSPVRNRIVRSPRSRKSRSPIHHTKSRSPIHHTKSRSRSPIRCARSPPRKRYSRSPPQQWHHSSRISPRHRRQSPRSSRPSPHRSPDSRWWPSPRRSPSPRARSPSPRARSPSPLPRHVSPRSRRISESPSRPLSPLRRRMSPSPARRNPSPPRRFSPPRRNPSPPRSRYSRSFSRSPERFVSRGRSPVGNRVFHHGSPRSPKRRASRSLSPRRRLSRSPFGRPLVRHSPVGRKLSPWSPPRQSASQKISPNASSPSGKHRSPSPYGRQRRSDSPSRRLPAIRHPPRNRRSPARDLRRPLQESRMNNIHHRSRSPLPPRRVDRSCSPRHSRSPVRRSRSISRASSISLSPSPERDTANTVHRYKSPLRVHTADYRNTTVPVVHSTKEGSCGRQRNISPLSGAGKKQHRTRPDKRKEPRNKVQKRDKSAEDLKETDRRSREELQTVVGDRIPVLDSTAKNNVERNDSAVGDTNLALMEARRRKFESASPVRPDGKKIRLKAKLPQSERTQAEEIPPKQTEERVESVVETLDDDSLLLDHGDELDLDEPCLELESADLWSEEESESDNEARFKSGTKTQTGLGGKPGVLPFTKLLEQGNPQAKKEHKKTSSFAKKSSTSDRTVDTARRKQVLSKEEDNISLQETKKTSGKQQTGRELQDASKVDNADNTSSDVPSEMESKLEPSSGKETGDVELAAKNREGDLRTELSRRRAERLTKAGSLHEKLPARLLQSAFVGVGVVGKKNVKHSEREDKQTTGKRAESKKEKTDVRRVLVLKRQPVPERRVASISVTIPKGSKCELKPESPPSKLPIRMRLGLPASGSPPDDCLMPRRRSRKVKLKRNVMLGSRPADKLQAN